jgi:septum formation inhibitor-activating ATPase MinD
MRPDAAGGTDGQAPDLIDILQDHSRLSSAFTSSEQLPQLVCLAPGAVPDESRNQIVRSPELQELLQILSEEFDHLVFDVPPVLGHANSLTLLRWADASLLVVKHRGTTVSEVRRSLETMDPTPNLGVVLNQYRTRIPAGVRRLLGE